MKTSKKIEFALIDSEWRRRLRSKSGSFQFSFACLSGYFDQPSIVLCEVAASRSVDSYELKPFCNEQLKRLVGEVAFNELRAIYDESGSVKQLTNKYMQVIGALDSEQQRVDAERVGLFCKKIYRMSRFDPTYLTTWLSAEQRELQHMIEDAKIGDEAVYDRLFEFYEGTKGEKKNDAREIIESGCKWFIAHMLGEDIADVSGTTFLLLTFILLRIFSRSRERETWSNLKTTEFRVMKFGRHCDLVDISLSKY
ncbi:unnamed protein product [Toxocara canis]|uniref:Polyprotein allergen nematode domain-containing protein n=1 Tax=Toxocara canis TaxID=6265 RepID=A0A3P7F6H2_TOXCA|nr:unnamed protein product [Toxocara canis]